jgi:hypothetical protein
MIITIIAQLLIIIVMKKIITQNQILQNFLRFKQSCWSLLLLLICLLSTNNTIGQTFRSYASDNASAASVNVTKPLGLEEGDLMIAQISRTSNNNTTMTNSEGTGWSIVSGKQYYSVGVYRWHTTVLSKIATAADVAATTFTFTGNSTDKMSGAIMAFFGGGDVSVIGAWGTTSNDSTFNAPAITTLTPSAMVIMIGATIDDRSISNWTFNSTSMTEIYDYKNPATTVPIMSLAAATLSLSAIATNATGSANLTSSAYNTSILLAISGSNTAASVASSTPTLCINTALTNITHLTSGAIGIGTATNLPAGVTASWASNTITITGTPTVSGTFNYSIPLTVYSGSANATGIITVTPTTTVGSASSTPTLCVDTGLTPITHATTNTTGIGTAIGLPAGVTASWASNTITITGTPTASGTFNYTIPLTSECGTVDATGTITVTVAPTLVTAVTSATAICTGGSVNLISSATSNSATSTTLISENFDSTPTGWTTTNTSSGGSNASPAWTLRANGYTYGGGLNVTFYSDDASAFYLSNSHAQGIYNSTETTLVSPAFSTIGLLDATINLSHYYRNSGDTSDRAYIQASTNGSSWTTITTYSSTQGSINAFATQNISLPASFLNKSTVYIQFYYKANYDYF